MKRVLCHTALAIPCLLMLALAACGGHTWETRDITGLMPDLRFTLHDTQGRMVHAATYGDKIKLLYFGYTHCPDVCPLTLADIVAALRKIGARPDAVQVLFVSVDPKRDTLPLLHQYAKAFGPWVVGLTGTQAQLKSLSKRYRVSYSYGKPDARGNYVVNHSAAIFVFDGENRVRLLMNHTNGKQAMAHDLKQLLHAGSGS